jgi:hypothetical protein
VKAASVWSEYGEFAGCEGFGQTSSFYGSSKNGVVCATSDNVNEGALLCENSGEGKATTIRRLQREYVCSFVVRLQKWLYEKWMRCMQNYAHLYSKQSGLSYI